MFWETAFNPPNFLQGLIQIGEAFVNIAQSAMEILNPFTAVERIITEIGKSFGSVIGGATSFFSVLTDPQAATNIMKIGKAISDVKIANATAFITAMTATAAAQTAGVATTTTRSENKTQTKQEIVVNLMLDRDKLATVVKQINGQTAVNAIAGRE